MESALGFSQLIQERISHKATRDFFLRVVENLSKPLVLHVPASASSSSSTTTSERKLSCSNNVTSSPTDQENFFQYVCKVYSEQQNKKKSFCLSIKGVRIDPVVVSAIFESLCTESNCLQAQLINCQLSSALPLSLAAAFEKNSSITELDLSQNHLGNDGVAFVCQSLQKNKQITKLVIDDVGLESDGPSALFDLLRSSQTLSHCSLLWHPASPTVNSSTTNNSHHNSHHNTNSSSSSSNWNFKVGFFDSIIDVLSQNTTLQRVDVSGPSESFPNNQPQQQRCGADDPIIGVKVDKIRHLCHRNEAVSAALKLILESTFTQRAIQIRTLQTNLVREVADARAGITSNSSSSSSTSPPVTSPDTVTATSTASRNFTSEEFDDDELQRLIAARGRSRGRTMDMSLMHTPDAPKSENLQKVLRNPSKRYKVGHADTIGRRKDMQDAMVIVGCFRGNENEDLFCIFDGHGTAESATYVANHFPDVFEKALNENAQDPIKSLRAAFLELDDAIKPFAISNGTTAVVSYIRDHILYCANVGDARCVIDRNGQKPIRLTIDHNCDLPEEQQRIEAMGGFIRNGRVKGALQVTRALGDWFAGDWVSSDPWISVTHLTKDDFLLVLACDGLFEIFTDESAAQIAHSFSDPQQAAERLKDQAFLSGGTDNISVQVVILGSAHNSAPPPPSADIHPPFPSLGTKPATPYTSPSCFPPPPSNPAPLPPIQPALPVPSTAPPPPPLSSPHLSSATEEKVITNDLPSTHDEKKKRKKRGRRESKNKEKKEKKSSKKGGSRITEEGYADDMVLADPTPQIRTRRRSASFAGMNVDQGSPSSSSKKSLIRSESSTSSLTTPSADDIPSESAEEAEIEQPESSSSGGRRTKRWTIWLRSAISGKKKPSTSPLSSSPSSNRSLHSPTMTSSSSSSSSSPISWSSASPSPQPLSSSPPLPMSSSGDHFQPATFSGSSPLSSSPSSTLDLMDPTDKKHRKDRKHKPKVK